jgi:hypothetical protein
MKTRVTKFVVGASAALLLSGVAQNSSAGPHCLPISGTVMTNLGVVNASTTLGVVDGDLKGAVAATILNVTQGPNGTAIFTVQHHFVTQSGDTILTGVAVATATQVAPGLYAILDYPVHITGGTGRFAGATGDFNNIGAADFGTGRTIFRYSGQVCFPESD